MVSVELLRRRVLGATGGTRQLFFDIFLLMYGVGLPDSKSIR